MNFWLHLLKLFWLMLIYSHFGFSMENRHSRKSKLNPDAPAFVPQLPRPEFLHQPHQHQSIPNQNYFQYSIPNTSAYHSPSRLITNLPKFQSNQITKNDLKEHEALSILPKYLFDWEKNDEIDDEVLDENRAHSLLPKFLLEEFGIETKNDVIVDNIDQNEIGEAESSQTAHKTIPREEEGNVHLTDLKGEEGSSQGVHLIPPKLNVEVEKSVQVQVDPTQLKSELTLQKELPKEGGGDIDQLGEVGSSGAAHKAVFREWEEDGNANFIDRQKLKVVTDQGAHRIPPKLNAEVKNSVKIGNNKIDPTQLKSESSPQKEQPNEGENESHIGHLNDQKESSSQGPHLAPRKKEKESSVHLSNREMENEGSSSSQVAYLTPKLNEVENPIQVERIENDQTQMKLESTLQKELPKEIKEEDTNKKPPRKLNSKQRKREKQKQQQEGVHNAANQLLQHLYESDRKDSTPSSSLITDKSYMEKLMDTAKISSSSSSNYRKEKQIHSHQPKQQQYSEQIAEKQQLSSHGEDISPQPQGNSGSFSTSHSTQKHQQTNRVDVGTSLTSDKNYKEKLMDFNTAKIQSSSSSSSRNAKSQQSEQLAELATNSRITVPSASVLPQLNTYKAAFGTELLLNKIEAYEKFKEIDKIMKNLKKKLNELEKQENNWLAEKVKQFRAYIDKNGISNEKELKIIEQLDEYDENYKPMEEISKLTEERDKLKEEISKSSNNKIKRELRKKLNLTETNLSKMEKQKNEKNLTKAKIVKLHIALMNEFMKMKDYEKPETNIMKAIQEDMKKPLISLWTEYNLVLNILNEYWKKQNVKNELKRPYHFISEIFGVNISKIAADKADDIVKFSKTMQFTLEKMLRHQNIYKTMNIIINEVVVHERLNCFDVLSKKIKELEELMKENLLEDPAEQMKTLGKFFKEELNHPFHQVFNFIIAGLDKSTDVWDQIVLKGIDRLTEWLPKDRRRRFNEIWVQLFDYYKNEKSNLEMLSHNDGIAVEVFDLFPDEKFADELLNEQLEKIRELEKVLENKFSTQIRIRHFILNVFIEFEDLIQCINMLLKIQKRVNDAKPLPYLKSVYDKYWYIIYRDRFIRGFATVLQYKFSREKSQIYNKDVEKIVGNNKQQENEAIFKQINSIEPNIVNGIMEIISEFAKIVHEHGIWERAKIFKNDKNFMSSTDDENPNEGEYDRRERILIGGE